MCSCWSCKKKTDMSDLSISYPTCIFPSNLAIHVQNGSLAVFWVRWTLANSTTVIAGVFLAAESYQKYWSNLAEGQSVRGQTAGMSSCISEVRHHKNCIWTSETSVVFSYPRPFNLAVESMRYLWNEFSLGGTFELSFANRINILGIFAPGISMWAAPTGSLVYLCLQMTEGNYKQKYWEKSSNCECVLLWQEIW